FPIFQVYANPRFFYSQRATVTFEARNAYDNSKDQDRIYDTFSEIFSEYAKIAPYEFYPFDRSSLQLTAKSYNQKHPTATFEVDGIDCLAFQDFLLGIRSAMYNLRSVRVDCSRVSFSLCYEFDCNVKDVPNTTDVAPVS
ncbi:hypothetical protein OESDEN_23961, partial [Oesophagostomum dentatum]